MISLDYLIWLNEAICQDSGEQSIIINKNNLLSALSVQQWYFDDSLLAAALIRSITIGHGFQDGNKRTAAAAGATICKFTCTDAEATECIMQIATGQLRDVQDIAAKLYPDKHIKCSSSQLTANQSEVQESNKSSDAILEEVERWAAGRTKGFRKFDKYGVYLEKHSIEDLIKNYIKYFNQNVRDYGDGFATDWDSDDTMDILYKNGKIRTINPDFDEGTKRISIDGIDSIIVNGGWGTAFAGPSIVFEDYTVYDDIVDIRPEFDTSYWRK